MRLHRPTTSSARRSLGDTCSPPSALVLIDSVVRLLPGALGDDMSAVDESFSRETGLLEYAQYTRPAGIVIMAAVPEVCSG